MPQTEPLSQLVTQKALGCCESLEASLLLALIAGDTHKHTHPTQILRHVHGCDCYEVHSRILNFVLDQLVELLADQVSQAFSSVCVVSHDGLASSAGHRTIRQFRGPSSSNSRDRRNEERTPSLRLSKVFKLYPHQIISQKHFGFVLNRFQ